MFYGLLRGIKHVYDLSNIMDCNGVTDAIRVGNSKPVKLPFWDNAALKYALRIGLKIDYDFLSVVESKAMSSFDVSYFKSIY
jgi:exonuclease III